MSRLPCNEEGLHGERAESLQHDAETVTCRRRGRAPQRVGHARRVAHLRLEALDLRLVVLQAGADGRLERVDGDKVREERQHVLDADAPLRLLQHFNHCRHALALRMQSAQLPFPSLPASHSLLCMLLHH
jgi:hypothetical protein